MNPTEDTDKFDDLQIALLSNFLKSIKADLEEAGIKDDQLFDLVGSIGFSASCIFDGSTIMTHDGKPLVPLLTFSLDDEGNDVVFSKNGSWMHEYVFGCVDEILEEGLDEDVDPTNNATDEQKETNQFSFSVYITYSNGLQLEYSVSSVLGTEVDSVELAEMHYHLFDPTGEKMKIETKLRPREVSPLFSSISSVHAIDDLTDKSYDLDISDFENLTFQEINHQITEQCKNL